jgi:flagellar biosynthesis protein FlhF
MRIKSYFANSIQDAMEQARVELGSEAMLVNSRRTDPELKHLGAYEVVFGTAGTNGRLESGAAQPPGAVARKDQRDPLMEEMAELRRQIESVKRSVSRQSAHLRLTGLERWPDLERTYDQLLAADFSQEIAQDLVQAAAKRMPEEDARPLRAGSGASGIEAAVIGEIERRLRIAPEIGRGEPERRVALFAGPPGCGKTSTLVKIAIAYGIKQGIPVQIISTDTLRVGAAEQLSAYARIMGAGFQAVHTLKGLGQALDEHRAKRLVLIDTPGYAPGEMEDARELAGFLGRQSHIAVHLLLPAVLRQSVLARISERFEMLGPATLVFTHFDEADRPGAVLDQAIRTGIPVSFLSRGQKIPEDIVEASKQALLERLWEPADAAAVSAA